MKGGTNMKHKMSTQKFEYVYQKYKMLLFHIAFSYVKNREDTEDILQDAFAKWLYHAPEFKSEEHEKRWLIRVTVNLSKNHLKLFWNKNKVTIEELPETLEWNMSRTEINLLDEVMALPDKCKISMYLHYYEGYTCREIANILKCTESAVKMRLQKGRKLLKMNLSGGDQNETGRLSETI